MAYLSCVPSMLCIDHSRRLEQQYTLEQQARAEVGAVVVVVVEVLVLVQVQVKVEWARLTIVVDPVFVVAVDSPL